jgi:uncharacterized protein (TIGR02145 family)
MTRLFIAILLCLTAIEQNAQTGVSINGSGTSPDPSSMLDVKSTTSGFLLPRMTTAERDAIVNPAQALQIFNLTTNCLQIYIAPVWQNIVCGCDPPAAPSAVPPITAAGQVQWNWSTVAGATGYRYNTVNNYSGSTATLSTTYTQTGLACGTAYTLFVWTESECGHSGPLSLSANTASCSSCGAATVTDIDGNVYNTVSIGTQCWMKENLNVTRNSAGGAINRYCHDCVKYGGHYDWATIMAGSASSNSNPSGVHGICPTGWHIPSQSEWLLMTNYLKSNGYHCGSNTDWVAKAVANTSGWAANPWSDPDNCTPANNQPANNASGLTIKGGGYWNPTMQQYYQSAETIVANIHEGYLWTSTQSSGSDATFYRIGQYYYEPGFTDYTKNGRGNVRCVED